MMMMPSIFGGNLFNDDWMDFSFPDIDKELYGKHAKNLMKTDVKEKDGNYEVAIDLPGFKKDEITAELKDGYLTISAAKGLDKDEKDKEGKYIRRERYAGNMSRSFYVGKDITEKDIHGKYENGILMLDIPKKAPEKKVEEKKFIVVDELNFDEIKTKKFQAVLNNLNVNKALVVLEDGNKNVEISAKNIPDVKTAHTNTINVYDILKYNTVIATKAVVAAIEEVYA